MRSYTLFCPVICIIRCLWMRPQWICLFMNVPTRKLFVLIYVQDSYFVYERGTINISPHLDFAQMYNVGPRRIFLRTIMAACSKARTVSQLSNTEIVVSSDIRGMYIRVYSLSVLSCTSRGLAMDRFPTEAVLSSFCVIHNFISQFRNEIGQMAQSAKA
jgi:hypothetical protein